MNEDEKNTKPGAADPPAEPKPAEPAPQDTPAPAPAPAAAPEPAPARVKEAVEAEPEDFGPEADALVYEVSATGEATGIAPEADEEPEA